MLLPFLTGTMEQARCLFYLVPCLSACSVGKFPCFYYPSRRNSRSAVSAEGLVAVSDGFAVSAEPLIPRFGLPAVPAMPRVTVTRLFAETAEHLVARCGNVAETVLQEESLSLGKKDHSPATFSLLHSGTIISKTIDSSPGLN